MNPSPTRTIILWSPDWPITAVTREEAIPAATPIALMHKGTVFACSATARAEGVVRGLRVREAQSRCPGLVALPYQPVLDHRAFEPIVAAMEGMTPGVQVVRPGMLAIRARGPARYYGGERPAGLSLIGGLADLGVTGGRVGIADGPFTAEHAARLTGAQGKYSVRIVPAGKSAEFLEPLSVGVLGDAQLVTLLRRLGIRTLGEFAVLDRVDVRERFGSMGARLHALASGLDSSGVAARTPPKQLERFVDFEPALDRVDQVTFGVLAISEEFIAGLIADTLVCTGIRVEIESETGGFSARSWLHPRSFTATEVVDRVRWQLQGGATETGLDSGIVRVRIIPESVDAISNHEQGLWGSGPDERVHHALSRVQSMLGHEGVLTATIGGGRALADRQQLVAWGDRPADAAAAVARQPWPGQLPAPAPATVFAVPHPVHVLDAAGNAVRVDGRGTVSAPPARFAGASGARLRTVTAWAGPWPLDERWWSGGGGRAVGVRRSIHRFQVVDADGVAWLLVLDGDYWVAEARYD
jgi:protein ImuB